MTSSIISLSTNLIVILLEKLPTQRKKRILGQVSSIMMIDIEKNLNEA